MFERFSRLVQDIGHTVGLVKVAQQWGKIAEKMPVDQNEQQAQQTLQAVLQLSTKIEQWSEGFVQYEQKQEQKTVQDQQKDMQKLDRELRSKLKGHKDIDAIVQNAQEQVQALVQKMQHNAQLKRELIHGSIDLFKTNVRMYGFFLADALKTPGHYSQEQRVYAKALLEKMEHVQLLREQAVQKKVPLGATGKMLTEMAFLTGHSMVPVSLKIQALGQSQEGTLDASKVHQQIEDKMLALLRSLRTFKQVDAQKEPEKAALNEEKKRITEGKVRAGALMECAQVHFINNDRAKMQQCIDDAYVAAGHGFCRDELGLDEKGKMLSKALVSGFIEAAIPMVQLAHQTYAKTHPKAGM